MAWQDFQLDTAALGAQNLAVHMTRQATPPLYQQAPCAQDGDRPGVDVRAAHHAQDE
jgi:hypothetical protein